MMIKERFTKIVNFMICGAGFFGARMWPYKSYNEHNESHVPHGSPEETVKISKHKRVYQNIDLKKKKNYCLLFEGRMVPTLSKLESPSPNCILCQIW